MYSFFTSSSFSYFNGFTARRICRKMRKILKFKHMCNIGIKRIFPEPTRKSASTIPSTVIMFTLFIFREKTGLNERPPDEIMGSASRIRDCVLLRGSPSSQLPQTCLLPLSPFSQSILYCSPGVAKLILLIVAASNM
jgi:hypothetical protein